MIATIVLAAGCYETSRPPEPCVVEERLRVERVDNVDLLFVIDNSNDMMEEQVSLASQFSRLVAILGSGDRNPDDGIIVGADFPPVASLQVGVITGDMGTGGFRVPTCNEPNFGDDGILRREGNDGAGCLATYPTAFSSYLPAAPGADPMSFAQDLACIAVMGYGGCGYQQPLEAALKAVTPSTQPPVGEFNGVFGMGQPGHADNTNAGFVRSDSLLAIVLLSSEEDCSARLPDLFNPGSAVYTGDLNLRCFTYPDAVHPIGRFVDGLLAQRSSPDMLVFAAIVGVPPETVADPGEPTNYDAILDHPLMQEMIDPAIPTQLRPSCDIPGRGQADPPRRIVEVARGLAERGAASTVQSICQTDLTSAIEAILDAPSRRLGIPCLSRSLDRGTDGRIDCDVVETLPTTGPFTSCAAISGRERLGVDPDSGGEHCRVAQLPATGGAAPTAPGWFYDDFSAEVLAGCGRTPTDGQRVVYTAGNEPPHGTLARLECRGAAVCP